MTGVEVMTAGRYTRIEAILEKTWKRTQADNEVNLSESFPDI